MEVIRVIKRGVWIITAINQVKRKRGKGLD
jgi:hypothetical protein